MNVLSKLLDKAALERRIGYHPKCQNMGITHLSFADDIMVFTDGKIRSIDSITEVFDYFAKISGLKINMEKSTIYLAGISEERRTAMELKYSIQLGTLPVRYLGLPLLTKRMTAVDYKPLLNRIKSRISSWTARHLSMAGRLTLIKSVIVSITNFWLSAFRLPQACLNEVEKMCGAFLWSGPSLNARKAKVSWKAISYPKNEGGLGIRSLREVNNVCCLRLIWRILTSTPSL